MANSSTLSHVGNFDQKSNWDASKVNLGNVFEGAQPFLSSVDKVNAATGKKTYATSGFSYFGDGYSTTTNLLTPDQIAGVGNKSLNSILAESQSIETGLRTRTGKTGLNFSPTIVLYSADKSTGAEQAIKDMTTGATFAFSNLILQVAYLESRERQADASSNPLGITTVINPDLIKSVDEESSVQDAIKNIDYNKILADAYALIRTNKQLYSWLPETLPTIPAESWMGWSGYNKAIGFINKKFAPSVAWSAQMQVYDHKNMYNKELWWGSKGQASGLSESYSPQAAAAKAVSAFKKAGTFTNGYAPDFITFDKYEADDFSLKGGKPFNDTIGTAQVGYYAGFNYKNYLDYVNLVSTKVDGASSSNPMPVLLWQLSATHIPTKADYVNQDAKLYQHVGYVSDSNMSSNEDNGRNIIKANPRAAADRSDNKFVTPHMLGFTGTYLFGDSNLKTSKDIHPALSNFSLAPASSVTTPLQAWEGAKYYNNSWADGNDSSPKRWPQSGDYATTLPQLVDQDLAKMGSTAYVGALNQGLPKQVRGIQFGGGETTALYNYKSFMGAPDYAWAANKATDYLNSKSAAAIPTATSTPLAGKGGSIAPTRPTGPSKPLPKRPTGTSKPKPIVKPLGLPKAASSYRVGFYQQISGNYYDSDWETIRLKPTDKATNPSFTPGADEYYLGLLTNSLWGATGGATGAPPAYQWSPLAGTKEFNRPKGDAVKKPLIPGADKVVFVLGGNDYDFGKKMNNPGVPTSGGSSSWGRVSVDSLKQSLNNQGWDGIDWDEELTSPRGPAYGYNLSNAALVINGTPDKHHIWTPMAHGDPTPNNWMWKNLKSVIGSAKSNIDGVNLMGYYDAMWRTAGGGWESEMYQSIPRWIKAIADTGYDLKKVKIGLHTHINTSAGAKDIVDANGNWNEDGRKALGLYLDLVTGTKNSYFKDQSYVGKQLGGVFVWNRYNAEPDLKNQKPIPKPILELIDSRLGTSLAKGLSSSQVAALASTSLRANQSSLKAVGLAATADLSDSSLLPGHQPLLPAVVDSVLA